MFFSWESLQIKRSIKNKDCMKSFSSIENFYSVKIGQQHKNPDVYKCRLDKTIIFTLKQIII